MFLVTETGHKSSIRDISLVMKFSCKHLGEHCLATNLFG